MRRFLAKVLLLCVALTASACTEHDIFTSRAFQEAKITEPTRATTLLRSIPAPAEKIAVAVYSFDDQTGQFKANEKLTEYSSAVTKGGLAILNNALLDAGNKTWFTVIERGGLKNVLQERQIIRAMREQYRTQNGDKLSDIQPLLYAGMLIEGGIIGYDTNTVTGGLAANYFGIGGNTEYRSNTVTVYLRAVNIHTGEVLISTTSSKTIYSMRLQGNIFKYITSDRLLQAETGFTLNEPVEIAVRQAIETAVYSMIMEGAKDKHWGFANPSAGKQALNEYFTRKAADSGEEPPAPAATPQPVVTSREPEPAYAPTAPVMPVMTQPTVAAPQYRDAQPTPILPPEAARESTIREPLPPEPLPQMETIVAPQAPAAPALPAVKRTPEPNALIRYLNDSRYAPRRNTPTANCELDPRNPECRK